MAVEFYSKKRPVIQGVLFDMDGVILDTEILYTRFWREACAHFGFAMSMEQALGMRSLGVKGGGMKLHSYFGEGADFIAIRNKRIELMNAFIEKEGVALKSGVKELLSFLKEHGIKTAIATSSPVERAEEHLGMTGVYDLFDEICSGYFVEHPKPAPDLYEYAAKKVGLLPQNCLAVEDSPTGILSAYRANCLPVMVPDLDQPDEETKKFLFAKADSLLDLIELIDARQ